MKLSQLKDSASWRYLFFSGFVWGIAFTSYALNTVVKAGIIFCAILIIAYFVRYFFFDENKSFSFLEIFIVTISSYISLQLLQSYNYWGNLSISIDRVWNYEVLLWGVHLFFSFFILLSNYRQKIKLVFGSIFCTSIFFLPISSTPEGSLPFQIPTITSLILLGEAFLLKDNMEGYKSKKAWLIALSFFLVFLITSIFFSSNPGDSLIWVEKFIVLLVAIFSVSLIINNWQEWRQILIFTLFVNLLPLLFASTIKFLQISLHFNLISAITYRLNLTEFGRANLIARELMISFPVLVSAWINADPKWLRNFYLGLLVLTFVFFGLCQSWGGLIGSIFVVLSFFVIYKRNVILKLLPFRTKKYYKIPAFLIVCVGMLVAGTFFASRINIGTFNGRLFQFRASFWQLKDHLITGLGPGIYHIKAAYANKINWVADTDLTINNPLLPIRWYQDSSTYHAHNLFLEIGVGSGVFALISFVGFLFFFIRYGVDIQKKDGLLKKDKIYIIGLLLSLIAAIGWGFLDVMQTMPPFFATSVWVFVSLIISAEKLLFFEKIERKRNDSKLKLSVYRGFIFLVLFCMSIYLLIFTVGNGYYRKAFQSLRMQDWRSAVDYLNNASLWEPLNAKYQQLRAEALINLGDYAGAENAYERALQLKRNFAPYERQLGWLAWMRGDLQTAELHFTNAIAEDPNNAWSSDLYNSLALVKAAEGDFEATKDLFAIQLMVTPDLPVDSIWQFYGTEDGEKYIFPDPVLVENKVGTAAFQNRILVQLGKANFTNELLDHPIPDLDKMPILFDDVFPIMEKTYEDIPMQNVHDKRVKLATLVQAAQGMGLNDESDLYAQKFINDFPDSVFGYQKMAAFEFEKGHFQTAVDWLEMALQVSHNEKNTLLQLADVTIASGNWEKFNDIYSILEKNYPLDVNIYRQKFQSELLNGRKDEQVDALKHIVALEAKSSDYLDIYDILKENGSLDKAKKYCSLALDKSLISNSPLFSNEVGRIGQCFADIYGQKFESKLQKKGYQNPRLVSVITFFGWRSLGEIEKEIKISQTLLTQYPSQWEFSFLDSILMKDLGKLDLEEQQLLEAIKKDPIQLLPRLTLGERYEAQNRQEEAMQLLVDTVTSIPGSQDALVKFANAEVNAKKTSLASEYLQRVQRIGNYYSTGQIYSFWTEFPNAEIDAPSGEYVHPDFGETYAKKNLLLFMHPESSAQFLISLPNVGDSQTINFNLSVGMLPQSWLMEGDGVQFEVGLIAGGETETLFEAYIDPKQNLSKRYWHPVSLDLTAYQGDTVSIILKTSAGPNNDNRFDWAGWGNPAIIIENHPTRVP